MKLKNIPNMIRGESYHKFHPAIVKQSSHSKNWDGLFFSHYSHPKHFRGAPRPATSDHILAFGCGGAVAGENSINSDKWKPYIWRKDEWFMGPAYGNDRDSRWDTLCAENEDLDVCYIHLAPKIIEKAAIECGNFASHAIEFPAKLGFKDPLMLQLGYEIKKEVERNNPFGRIFIETAANLLAIHLLKEYALQPCKIAEAKKSEKNSKAVQNAIEYINDYLDQELSLDVLACKAHMSVYHFSRLFKQCTGLAPHQYVMQARMKKACILLRHTRLPINIIAADIGYTASHFVQVFKQNYGVTPRRFRASN